MAFSSSESNSRPLIWALRMRFSAARYSFPGQEFLVDRSGNVGQQLCPNHFGPFLIALTLSRKEIVSAMGALEKAIWRESRKSQVVAFQSIRVF